MIGGAATRSVSPRRVCMVVHASYPPDPRVEREVRVALGEGHEVEVVAMRDGGQPAREVVDGALVVRLPISHKRGGGLVRVISEYVGFTAFASCFISARAIRRRFDVIHVNNPPDFLVLTAAVPKLLGARLVFDVHDFSWEMFSQRFDGRVGGAAAERLLRLIERLATRYADDVVTVHEPYRRALIARGVSASKTTVVMNSVDETLLPATLDGPPSDAFRVVYHGTITPHYGVDLLVEAAAQVAEEIPNLRLEIYGAGDAVAAVRDRVEALGIADRTMLCGRYVPHAEILRLVRSADTGVIPNLPIPLNEHALPTKLFEYVTLGVPVVSADLPTLRRHFSDDEVLFYRAGNAAALAAALTAVARERQAATARAARALRRYEQYRWSISARRYALILASSAEPARPSPEAAPDGASEDEHGERAGGGEGDGDQRPVRLADPASG
jgi:glycosyltransferase involved in cell wall biosynthesis